MWDLSEYLGCAMDYIGFSFIQVPGLSEQQACEAPVSTETQGIRGTWYPWFPS